MDSSIISILVALFVGWLITMAEKWINKPATDGRNERPKQPQARPRHVSMPPRREVRPAPAATPMAVSRPAVHPAKPATTEAPAEGQRVTTDAPAPRRTVRRRALPPMPGGNLRSAIIWSEILGRKF